MNVERIGTGGYIARKMPRRVLYNAITDGPLSLYLCQSCECMVIAFKLLEYASLRNLPRLHPPIKSQLSSSNFKKKQINFPLFLFLSFFLKNSNPFYSHSLRFLFKEEI